MTVPDADTDGDAVNRAHPATRKQHPEQNGGGFALHRTPGPRYVTAALPTAWWPSCQLVP